MEALCPLLTQPTVSKLHQPTTIHHIPGKPYVPNLMTRRAAVTALTSLLLSSKSALFMEIPAIGGTLLPEFNFNMVAPDQTFEEAMSGVRDDAESLLEVRSLLESQSWGEAQRAMRKASVQLKKDIYTIIQNKPGNERPQLRKLYSDLFNGVTRLDYAARDADDARVWECYGRITEALGEILSRI
ncbi:hypothetical protein CRG98_027271 [Punica granatum]|nr:hypothetical protein CRG98_027271 [Punica granatum]